RAWRSPAARAPRRQTAPRAEQSSGARLRILVVDAEPQVRLVLQNVLVAEHDVDTAGDGETALTMVANNEPYDVILCDLMMPRMSGREVFEHIRTRWPGAERRVVFLTGGAFVPSLASFLESV